MTKPERYVFINGEYRYSEEASISVYDHGLLYGDGIFEGIRAYNGKVLKLEEHIKRLYASSKAIFLDIPIPLEAMMEIVIDTFAINNIQNGYIRLVITRGVGDLGLDPSKCKKPTIICIADDLTMYSKNIYDSGASIITSSYRRNMPSSLDPQIKSLNYLNNILAKIEANLANASEALMLNGRGSITECTGDNIFIVYENNVITPALHTGILNGITRELVIDLLNKNNIHVYEKEITLFNLYSADECFLTGTGVEIIPVNKADGRKIGNGKVGNVTKQTIIMFKDYVANNGVKIDYDKKNFTNVCNSPH